LRDAVVHCSKCRKGIPPTAYSERLIKQFHPDAHNLSDELESVVDGSETESLDGSNQSHDEENIQNEELVENNLTVNENVVEENQLIPHTSHAIFIAGDPEVLPVVKIESLPLECVRFRQRDSASFMSILNDSAADYLSFGSADDTESDNERSIKNEQHIDNIVII
jgi:hypothetical protein